MSLRTGTTLITLLNVFNKVSGIYGLLALLTGLPLSPMQLSMYLYSVVALLLLVYLSPHIRQMSPLQNLILAYFYAFDSLLNAAYTAAFSLAWFTVLATHNTSNGGIAGVVPGGSTIDETSGFTSPEHNVSHVDVSPTTGELVGHEANAPAGAHMAPGAGGIPTTLLANGSAASISVIAGLWAIRVYFVLILFAYARGCVRQAIAAQAQAGTGQLAAAASSSPDNERQLAENPFRAGTELGAGWKGQIGRLLTSAGRSFWLGADEQAGWARMEMGGARVVKGRGRKGGAGKGQEGIEMGHGVMERERRRRAGTGPPKPDLSVEVPKQ